MPCGRPLELFRSGNGRFSCFASWKIWICWKSQHATGLKEGTAKSHLFRALQAVRERLEEQSEPAFVD